MLGFLQVNSSLKDADILARECPSSISVHETFFINIQSWILIYILLISNMDNHTLKSYNDIPNQREQERELHYSILVKANIYVKIPLSVLNIYDVTVAGVYYCAAGHGTCSEC